MSKIDLHGIKHEDVPRKLDVFFWQMMQRNVSQIEVVTGISDQMKKIVKDVSKDYNFQIREIQLNPGSLIIDLV